MPDDFYRPNQNINQNINMPDDFYVPPPQAPINNFAPVNLL